MWRGCVWGTALRRIFSAAVAAALVGLAGGAVGEAQASAAASKLTVAGSAEQVYVLGAEPRVRLALLANGRRVVAVQRVDALGGALFRNVAPGNGYRVRQLPRGPKSAAVTVHSDQAAPWNPSIYAQPIADDGYQYLTTRDGTKLALTVWPPTKIAGVGGAPFALPGGLPAYAPPYPTLIEYSGYAYADPSHPAHGIAALANAMGFAVVDVSMRGTGCSGGAFDFYEPLQNLDGYDVIETIAHQPWVLDHKVGMMGISYGAISQLFTAQLNPPALEAISPLSTIDAVATSLYPGGIPNDDFVIGWTEQRQQEAQVAGAKGSQGYAKRQIDAGDRTCRADQALHPEAANLAAKVRANSHYVAKVADPLDPIAFVHKIRAPVFLACQWEDEDTGGHCPDLAQHMTGTSLKWFNFTNGAHVDSLDPYTYNHWFDFLQLFVAHQAPLLAPGHAETQAAAPVVYDQAMGTSDFQNDTFPADPIQQIPSYAGALAAFEQLPAVTVLFDNGAGTSPNGQSEPGDPYPGYIHGFSRFPVPGTAARFWYLGPHGTLSDQPARRTTVDWYTTSARALPLNDWPDQSTTTSGGLWGNASQWQWAWKQNPAGTAVSYVSAPLTQNTTVIGAGALHLWVRSSSRDVDLMATLSEVRPDGSETFVQNGWMRASERKLAPGPNNLLKQPSTLLEPIPTELARDARPMPKGKFVEIVVPLYYEGHAYRAGSRIRVTISAPNGTQPIWSFSRTEPTKGPATVWLESSPGSPSSLILPVVPGVSVPTALPPCPSLRNEPCRTYVPLVNRTSRR